jgi:hypothetical protein
LRPGDTRHRLQREGCDASRGKRLYACKVKAMTIMQECPEVKLPGGTRVTWKKERNGSRVLRRYAAK